MNESSAGRPDEMINTTRAVSRPFSPDSKDMATRYLWAEEAFAKLELPSFWKLNAEEHDLFYQRFDIKRTRPVQQTALAVAQRSPGIMVIEAPMGEGKTEAALVAAEVLAGSGGLRGVYFALPTQATSNAMFDRILKWIKTFDSDGERYSVRLAHGKAELNDEYRNKSLNLICNPNKKYSLFGLTIAPIWVILIST